MPVSQGMHRESRVKRDYGAVVKYAGAWKSRKPDVRLKERGLKEDLARGAKRSTERFAPGR